MQVSLELISAKLVETKLVSYLGESRDGGCVVSHSWHLLDTQWPPADRWILLYLRGARNLDSARVCYH